MTWVEDDNLVLPGIVVVLIEGKKLVDSQIGKHTADAIQENVWTAVLILDGDMVDDTPVNVLHELWRMGITGQCVLGVLCLGRIVLLFIQLVFQHGWMAQELLLVEKVAKLLKQIQRKHIHIVDRANEISLELLYLPTDVILLLCRILVDEEVIEQVAVLRVLETRAVQFIIKFFYRHITLISLCYLFRMAAGGRLPKNMVLPLPSSSRNYCRPGNEDGRHWSAFQPFSGL